MPGITRDTVISIARDFSYKVKEKDIDVKEILNADEAFFTGTACEIALLEKLMERKLIIEFVK